MDLYEALYTTRAMRRVAPDPIPEDIVKLMLDAAVRAPSGSNAQNWRWIVLTDKPAIEQLGVLYREAWIHLNETVYAGVDRNADPATARVVSSASWLADNFGQVPLVVMPYHRNDPSGASIYPAVWNMMLAARGKGIGTALTTVLGWFKEAEVAELLGVPLDKGWKNAAAVTCGYPLGRWGLAARTPAHHVVYADRWGDEPLWTIPEPMWSP
ncbi:MAG TPA: nitroreductase family protein [Acidimicrobiia bacterium]|jgi:nitroreductase|nr:nitroreductase family protein [Acidimicrobiia bacterium]